MPELHWRKQTDKKSDDYILNRFKPLLQIDELDCWNISHVTLEFNLDSKESF